MKHDVRLHGVVLAVQRQERPSGNGADELSTGNIQNHLNPFADVAGSARRDAPTRVTASTVSAIIQAPWGISIAPIWSYRSALPVGDYRRCRSQPERRQLTTSPLRPSPSTGSTATATSKLKSLGACTTDQLRPRRGAVSVQPARQQGVPRSAVAPASKRSARSSTSSTR